MLPDYYQILQISPQADSEIIQAVYRRLARKYHPDAHGDAEQMKRLNEAYAVLSDPQQRAAYDAVYHVPPSRPKQTETSLLYQSSLATEREAWLETSIEDCETEQRDGYFNLVITRSTHAAYKVWPPLLTNIELKINLVLPRTNGKHAAAGLVFRYSPDGLYRFAAHRDGYYSFSACVKNKWSHLIERQHSPVFEDENTLWVKAEGRKIALGVNDELLASLRDDKLAEGRVGFFAATGEEELFAAAQFKDFSISQIQRKN